MDVSPYQLEAQYRCPRKTAYVVDVACQPVVDSETTYGGALPQKIIASVARPWQDGATAGSLVVLDFPGLRQLQTIPDPHHLCAVADLHFLHNDCNCFISCGEDGAVRLWDLRSRAKAQRVFRDASNEAVLAVAVDRGDRMCAFGAESRIHAVDIGSARELFVNSEAHCEPVTSLRFHPHRKQELLSGSSDGLLCVLDTERCEQGGKAVEDDAGLQLVLNTCDGIRNISFASRNADIVCTISTSEVLQMWSMHEKQCGSLCTRFDGVRCNPKLCVGDSGGYLLDVLYDEDSGRAGLLAGSVDGTLAAYHLNLEDTTFLGTFTDGNNGSGHAGVVRGCARVGNKGLLATGGEDGLVCVWKPTPTHWEGSPPKKPRR